MRAERGVRFAAALTVLYASAAGTLSYVHESWADEAQAWLIARDAGPLGALSRAPFEGTPVLWHLLLWPFAALGAPFAAAKALNLAFAVSAVALFSLYAPFSRPTKTLFAFSYYMLYEYGALARNYSLTVALLFAAAALYGERERRPGAFGGAVALLANSSLFGLLAAAFLASAARPKGRGLAVSGAGIAAALLQLVPGLGFHDVYVDGRPVEALRRLKIAGVGAVRAFLPDPSPAPYVAALLAAATLAAAAYQLRRARRLRAAWAGFCLSMLAFFALLRAPSLRHDGLLMAVTAAFVWAAGSKGPFEPFWAACLALSLPLSLSLSAHEVRERFSNAQAMSAYIREAGLTEPIAAYPTTSTAALLPFLPGRRFWYASIRDWGTYFLPEKEFPWPVLGEKEVLGRVDAAFGADRPDLLLLRPLSEPAASGYVLLHAEAGPVFGYDEERYFLYGPADSKR